MHIEEIKNQALEYAKQFAENENMPFDFVDKQYTAKEWYLVMTLAQVYCNVIKGVYTREEGRERQTHYIQFVQEHPELFEGE